MKMKNRLLSILLTICMVALLLPVSATADDAVSYLYYADEAAAIAGTTSTGSCTNYTAVSDQTVWGEAGQEKWYVVNSSVTISDRITVSGDVHLILVDSYTLTAPKGIGVATGNSLTIYGQSADGSTMGVLKCRSVASNNAAIGGNNTESGGQITINGGKITVTGGSYAAGIGGGRSGNGSVTINGGIVTANTYQSSSSGCAGIGGGYSGSGTITINGGTVTATGSAGGAGIGGGGYGAATVTIRGGSVTAKGGESGGGIGSGSGSQINHSYTATVTISGGTVDASTGGGSGYRAAIGCGAYTTGTVTITGGNVTATATYNGVCIGGMPNDTGTNIVVTITGGNVTAKPSTSTLTQYQGIGGSNCTVILGWTNETDSITSPKWGGNGNSTVSFADGKSFQYQDDHTLADAASLREGATLIPFVPAQQLSVEQADVSGVRAWYPYTGSPIEPEPVVTYSGTLLVKDTDYTLSYTDDHTNLGEKAVTITGQGSYTGTKTIPYEIVEASTTYLDDTGAPQTCTTFQCLDQSDTTLSGGWYLVYDNLTINNRVSLTGDVKLILKNGKTLTSVKGISVPSTASLTIYAQLNDESTAGKLLITDPDNYFSGIGNDYKLTDRDSHGDITIVGGVINAKGGISGAAIGSALSASQGGNIYIKGGFVTANGTGGGAGVGSGSNTNGGTVTISGGKVTATSNGGAGIGGGGSGGQNNGHYGTINITGGTVIAKSEGGGAGIGGGNNRGGGTIDITGGTVTASSSGETGGAAIGGGAGAAGGSITIQNATIAKAAANAGAGIGSGGGETTGNTTIIIETGATITSATGSSGAGIGSGANGSATCSVTIEDGANVNTGSVLGAGIGGGSGASNFTVTIEGGTVNAWASGSGVQDKEGNLSAYGGAAIGGGANTNGGTVIITGGTVTARAIGGGAGIGSGANNERNVTTHSGSITISGGTVTATAIHHAAGIGGGRRSNGGNITISGGTITANGSDAAGIGRGGEDCLWEGKGSFYIPIVTDPTEETGGAYYDSIVQIAGTTIKPTDGTVMFTYADGGTVRITASSYPASPTLDKDFMYSDNGTGVTASPIENGKTIVPYTTERCTVTFAAGEGTGTMANASPIRGTTYTLPENAFTEPTGKFFVGWSVQIGTAAAVSMLPGDTIAVTADTTLTALWGRAKFNGHRLLLSGQIGVQFGMDLSKLNANESAASYMVFTVNGTDTRVNTSTLTPSEGRYIFTCFVNVLQMAEPIQATFHYGENGAQTVTNRFSVKDYVTYMEQHPNGYSVEAINLTKAIADYGHYAQIFLTKVNRIAPDKYAQMNTFYQNSYTVDDVKSASAAYQMGLDRGSSKIAGATIRLSLDSTTDLSVRLTLAENVALTASTTFNGKTYSAVKQPDGSYILTITGIPASMLGDTITISGDADGAFSVTVSALSYVYSILNGTDYSNDTNAQNAVCALYYYYQKAMAYKNSLQQQ